MPTEKNEIEVVHHSSMNQLEIFLVAMTSRGPHGHADLEIGVLLEGKVTLYIEKEPYALRQGDIYVINRLQIHSFSSQGADNKILAFQIRPELYRNINANLNYIRFEDNIIRSGAAYQKIRETLMACARAYFSGTLAGEIACTGLLLMVMSLLLHSRYSVSSEHESASDYTNAVRLNHMVDYISAHYSEKISLEDLAGLEHISACYTSHFIKNMLGVSFQEYLNQVRFEHALALFDRTDLSATDISMTVGFSSTRYLNQMFEAQFGCTCKEYLRAGRKLQPKYTVLPNDNIQRRFSFEESRRLLEEEFPV